MTIDEDPNSEIRTCLGHLASLWEPVALTECPCPLHDAGGGAWYYLNLMCQALFKPMGDLPLLNGNKGGMNGEGVEESGGGSNGRR